MLAFEVDQVLLPPQPSAVTDELPVLSDDAVAASWSLVLVAPVSIPERRSKERQAFTYGVLCKTALRMRGPAARGLGALG